MSNFPGLHVHYRLFRNSYTLSLAGNYCMLLNTFSQTKIPQPQLLKYQQHKFNIFNINFNNQAFCLNLPFLVKQYPNPPIPTALRKIMCNEYIKNLNCIVVCIQMSDLVNLKRKKDGISKFCSQSCIFQDNKESTQKAPSC